MWVTVEKDARSDIPEIDVKKYHVPGKMTLGEFIVFIRVSIRISKKRPIFDSFKNTKPPVVGLFYEIDEQNKGEDGFLHITYSGEENVCGSNEEQEHGDKISFENENSQEAANNPHATPVRNPPKQNIILMKSTRRVDNIPDNNSIEPAMGELQLNWVLRVTICFPYIDVVVIIHPTLEVSSCLQSMRETRISRISSH